MLKSVNMENWNIAKQHSCWATQPHNEQVLNMALKNGCTVVLFLSVNQSGKIQGYGRMTSTAGQGPSNVPWLDITEDVANFSVTWDCTVPIDFHKVQHLQNPWGDHRQGPRRPNERIPLNRHRDGQELAPVVGEALLAVMNMNATQAGTPVTGPLAGVRPATQGGFPQQQVMRPGQRGQQHFVQHMRGGHMGMAGRMGRGGMMMGQQGTMAGGMGMGGRGGGMMMMAGGPAGRAGRGMAPGMMQPMMQPAPPPGRPGPGVPAGLARFAGRLEGLPAMLPGQQQQQQQRPFSAAPQQQQQAHRGMSPPRGGGSSTDHGYQGHSRSRSRSRSGDRAGYRTAAAGGGGVSSAHRDDRGDSSHDVDANPDNLTYEMYLETFEKVQQRMKQVKKLQAQKVEQEDEQLTDAQNQQALVVVPEPKQQQQQQRRQVIHQQQPQQQLAPRQLVAGGGGHGMMASAVGGGVFGGDSASSVPSVLRSGPGVGVAGAGAGGPLAAGGAGASGVPTLQQ
jgi:hypothetical protein